MDRIDKKVLVVDDMPTILKQGVDIIGERYEVETASSAAEALEKVHSFKPDIILMDMNMPDENGVACMEEIHAIQEFKDIPVILTINDLTIMSTARAYDAGAADFLKKPFITRNVYRKIDMHLKLAEIGWHFEM
ncbi:MAG: response regulator [Lachnospiraceae bacterium]|nr:response regulator [Lachnospiraceae bacterium]